MSPKGCCRRLKQPSRKISSASPPHSGTRSFFKKPSDIGSSIPGIHQGVWWTPCFSSFIYFPRNARAFSEIPNFQDYGLRTGRGPSNLRTFHPPKEGSREGFHVPNEKFTKGREVIIKNSFLSN